MLLFSQTVLVKGFQTTNMENINYNSQNKTNLTNVTIYTDGSARGNPGNGGYGTILKFTDKSGRLHQKELSQGYRMTTNNRMEMMAVIAGLEALKKPCDVTVYSDSQYVVKAFSQHWIDGWKKKNWMRTQSEPVKNVDLWKRMLKAMKNHNVSFVWVRGHNGHTENELCDRLAVNAAESNNLIDDEGFKIQ